MTDRPFTGAGTNPRIPEPDRGSPSEGTTSSVPSHDGSTGPVTTGERRRRPLLEPFPLAAVALATFMALLAVLMARVALSTRVIPSSGTSAAAVMTGPGSGSVTTRTSGAAAASSGVQLAGAQGSAAAAPAPLSCGGAAEVGPEAGDERGAC